MRKKTTVVSLCLTCVLMLMLVIPTFANRQAWEASDSITDDKLALINESVERGMAEGRILSVALIIVNKESV